MASKNRTLLGEAWQENQLQLPFSDLHLTVVLYPQWVFQVALVVKNPPANSGALRQGPIPGLGRFPGGGHGNPLQYSCLENPTDRGACKLWSMASQGVRHN